jgi:flavin-dependent dehydrogenase
VRRAIGLRRATLRAQAIEVDTEPTDDDPRVDSLHFDFRLADLNGYSWDFPTIVQGERKVCRGVYLITGSAHAPARNYLARYLELRGLDIADYRLKQYAESGFEPGAAMSRPRVLLVGEAAGIDIASGEGIPQAIAYGELAATYLSASFRDGEFGFADWRHQVRSAGVGTRLRLRHLAYQLFFGPRRDIAERVALACPTLLDVAVRDFAGVDYGPIDVARGMLELMPQVAAHPSLFARSLRVVLGGGRSLAHPS